MEMLIRGDEGPILTGREVPSALLVSSLKGPYNITGRLPEETFEAGPKYQSLQCALFDIIFLHPLAFKTWNDEAFFESWKRLFF